MVMPSDQTQKTWVALMRAHKSAHEQVERALKAAKLPPISWYDVLWELEQTTECGIRAFELQPKLLLPQYGMSRLISKMENEDLIWRGECPEDGRGLVLAITEKGRELRKKMWAVYGPAMQQALGSKLTNEEVGTLAVILGKLHK